MKYRFVYLALAVLAAFSLFSCGGKHSCSDYWNGIERDVKYVQRFYPQDESLETNSTEKNPYELPTSPIKKQGVSKYRIGVVISGDYWEFYENFKALLDGFSSIGWMKHVNVPDGYTHVEEIFELLNQTTYSDYIEFAPEYFINLQWGEDDELALLDSKYFAAKPNLDVIMAYGGMAAKQFYRNESYPVPVLADAITDSKDAGLTVSVEDSGRPFFSGKIDPNLYLNQIKIFHEATGFKKLGIIYGDDEYGRIYGAVSAIEQASQELGFEIIRNTNVKEYVDDDTVELYLAALRDVVKKCDAVYIGASTAVTEYDITPQVVQILNDAHMPSFALEGSIRVKDGILYSFSAKSLTRSGIWVATKISHLFNGVEPGKLSQQFENAASMAINMSTALRIGYKVPFDVLSSSDEIYIDYRGTAVTLNTDLDSISADETVSEHLPKRKNDGSKYTVGVIVSGEYWEFAEYLAGIAAGLKNNGWFKARFEIKDKSKVSAVFNQIQDGSDYIEFPSVYFVNLDWGSKNTDKALALASNKDVDLLLVFGGVAAKLISEDEKLCVPCMIEGVTDPIGSKIVYSVSDSGNNYITCRVDPTQYVRQLQMFHELLGFKKLGIIYGNNDTGRLYSAVNDVDLVSIECGFDVVRNTNVKETVAADTPELYLKALRDLVGKVDAVYIGASTAVTEYDITGEIADILIQNKIPSFALEGEIRVKDGILMGMSSVEAENVGIFNANKMAAVFYGVIPRLLPQEFKGFPSIALNLDTANKIGLDFPLETLAAIDKLYMDGEEK